MSQRAVIIACARDETPYIAEWLSYHRAIGFGHVFLYCNDDDPAPLFDAVQPFLLGPEPFVTFHHYPVQGEQFQMYMHALRRYRDAGEWIAFLDIDEFLALRGGGTLDDLLDEVPPDQDCLLLNWVMFGTSGHAAPPPGGVPETYIRRAARVCASTKTITRSAAIDLARIHQRIYVWHEWEGTLAPGAASRTVLGVPKKAMPHDGSYLTDPAMSEAILRCAAVHHYAFRSEAALAQRGTRGMGGDFGGQAMWPEALKNGTAPATMAMMNEVEDTFLATFWAARRRRQIGAKALLERPAWPELASGRVAAQSSIASPRQDENEAPGPAGAVNGQPNGAAQSRTLREGDPWWQVDLGAAARLHELRVFGPCLPSPDRLEGFVLETSRDGRRWIVLAGAVPGPVGGVDTVPFRWRGAAPVTARYVRLRLRGTAELCLDQVQAYGTPVLPGGSGA
jgi:Glycosyl transferase family 2/F5/8 type C domain